MHCNGNSTYIFLLWELRGLSPNFRIHVSVSDLYIPRIGTHISSSRKGRPSWEYIIRSQTHECGNWDWGPNSPFLGIFVSNFRHFVFAVWAHLNCFVDFSCWCSTMKGEEEKESQSLDRALQQDMVWFRCCRRAEPVFPNVYGAQESIPRNQIHQPM